MERAVAIFVLFVAAASAAAGIPRAKYGLDFGWRFLLGDAPEKAMDPSFEDSAWRSLDLPHDFVVEGTFNKSADMSHGYLPFNKGWYRKSFVAPVELEGRSVWLTFDGVQTSATVWINGQLAGTHATGYTSFHIPADTIVAGQTNLIAVLADATNPDSWWYDGGGIYRHVWLEIADKVHIEPWGVWAPSVVSGSISRSGIVATASAIVEPEITVVNEAAENTTLYVYLVLHNAFGDVVSNVSTESQTVASGESVVMKTTMQLSNATLWSVEDPTLYTLTSTVVLNGNPVDSVDTIIGIRKLEFNADNGFFLNDKFVKIKGMCNHQDFAGLGVALPDSLQTWRVKKMKEMGANAWRTSHNSVNPELLDECDTQGMLVWDENHRNNVDSQGLEDLRSMLLRDRNHPSVIYWSLCNEALCNNFNAANAYKLIKIIHEVDPTRPATAAMNKGWGNKFSEYLDIVGFNYHPDQYDAYHNKHPAKPLTGSETSSVLTDRGIFITSSARSYVTAYDVNKPSWGNTAQEAWQPIDERAWMEGGFTWTGFDYKGEPTPYEWPNVNSHFGVIDIAGFPKDNFFLYQSMWLESDVKPMVHLLPHWNGVESEHTLAIKCTDTDPTQSWLFHSKGLIQASSGLCVSSSCEDTENGCFPANLVNCDEQSPSQIWQLNGSQIQSLNGTCLDLYQGQGPDVGIYMCTSSKGQLWSLDEENGTIISSKNAMCLTAGAGLLTNVWAYSNAPSVELFINGHSKGINTIPTNGHAEWNVTYEPGTLSAKAYDASGNVIAEEKVETTGQPAAIHLEAEMYDRDAIIADGQDVALIKASIIDSAGNTVPTASNMITFTITGVGSVVGVGNGDPSCHEPDKASFRSAWNGLARAIIGQSKIGGIMTLSASAGGLKSATIDIKVIAPEAPKPSL